MPRKPNFTSEKVLQVIQRFIADFGHPPTVEELRALLTLGSTRTALRYLQQLEAEGLIERWSGARGMRLRKRTTEHPPMLQIPIVGEAPAGPMMVAEENYEGWVSFSKDTLRSSGRPLFLLRVRGDSMNRATIQGKTIDDGDLVLVEKQSSAEDGQIIVALTDGQATIKRFKSAKGYVVLSPASSNKSHHPFVMTEDFQVQGVVIDVLKDGQRIIWDS